MVLHILTGYPPPPFTGHLKVYEEEDSHAFIVPHTLDEFVNVTGVSGQVHIASVGIKQHSEVRGSLAHVSLEGMFPNLQTIGDDLLIRAQGGLRSLKGFETLTAVQGDLEVSYADAPNLEGFNNLKTVGGDVSIYGMKPTSLNGLNSLSTIGGSLRVASQSHLDLDHAPIRCVRCCIC